MIARGNSFKSPGNADESREIPGNPGLTLLVMNKRSANKCDYYGTFSGSSSHELGFYVGFIGSLTI